MKAMITKVCSYKTTSKESIYYNEDRQANTMECSIKLLDFRSLSSSIASLFLRKDGRCYMKMGIGDA